MDGALEERPRSGSNSRGSKRESAPDPSSASYRSTAMHARRGGHGGADSEESDDSEQVPMPAAYRTEGKGSSNNNSSGVGHSGIGSSGGRSHRTGSQNEKVMQKEKERRSSSNNYISKADDQHYQSTRGIAATTSTEFNTIANATTATQIRNLIADGG